jgi:PTH1 family peptidyl-tRNA hydrolase
VAKAWETRLRKRRFSSKIAEVEKENKKIMLVLPQTYMNNSGVAVKRIMEGRNIQPEQLIVVYDDLDIPVGEIRIRKRGSSGTHKGMRSIIQEIETAEFLRMRIGIGPLPPGEDAVEYVLSCFNETEGVLLEESLKRASGALEMILNSRVEAAMNEYNQRGKTATG